MAPTCKCEQPLNNGANVCRNCNGSCSADAPTSYPRDPNWKPHAHCSEHPDQFSGHCPFHPGFTAYCIGNEVCPHA